MSDETPDPAPEPVPAHSAVEGPEESLDPQREQSHEAPGLGERVAVLETRERELLERLARLQADFDNFRRRSREEAAASASRGKETFTRALLPVLDGLERALAFATDDGLRLLARQLESALLAQGIVALDPIGQPFDAKLHEAIAQEAREGATPGTILVVAEKGYALEGRLLRPARVVVAA